VTEGSPAPLAPLAWTVNSVTVTIGGVAAPAPSFHGLTPGLAGLYQVNVAVPAGTATGDAVPVVLSVAGQTSPGRNDRGKVKEDGRGAGPSGRMGF